MHIHINACAHIFTHIHAYTYPGGMDNAAFIVDSIYMYIYINIYIYVYIYVYIYIYIINIQVAWIMQPS
jgi:hypothetical protein